MAALTLPEGHQILGKQVHIDVVVDGEVVRVVPDYVALDEEGAMYYIDAKNGPHAHPPAVGYSVLETDGGIYQGTGLARHGYTPGDALPPGRVVVRRF